MKELVNLMLTEEALPTPALVIEKEKLLHNIEKGKAKARLLGVTLRPHLKTHKSIDIARLQMQSPMGPATASTLKEARYYAEGGIKDIIYAVGIAPQKLAEVASIIKDTGANLKIILDSVQAAQKVSDFCEKTKNSIEVLIEVDVDGHRSGVLPNSEKLIEIAKSLTSGAKFTGILTHAGSSYDSQNENIIKEKTRLERDLMQLATKKLTEAGFPPKIVSVGSSPTFMYSENESGVTEIRAGVYVMGDLFQSNLGVCTINEIAASVLTTVIGHQEEKSQIIVDAGWLALSRDRGTANQKPDYGYGLVCDVSGTPIGQGDNQLIVKGANQEHGIIEARNAKINLSDYPIGTRLRILPNHACPTLAAHPVYLLVENERVQKVLEHATGWF